MVKKILSVAAATAVIATGASAFDVFDDGSFGNGLPYNFATPAAAQTGLAPNATAGVAFRSFGYGSIGDALIFPAFFVGNGWETTLRVVNTSQTNAVVAKVVLYAGDDSRELRDFNIYLSAGDVWRGTIKIDTDGNARLISTDDSSPLPGGGMADANNPMKSEPIATPAGYIAVIGCAMAVDPTRDFLGSAAAANAAPYNAADFKDARAHGDHAALRTAYNAMVADARGITTPVVFNNGVITSGAEVPNVSLTTAHTVPTNAGGDNKADYFFGPVNDVLVGDVRITDTVNGKDMVLPALGLQGVTDDTPAVAQALLYAEGEAAHIADRALTGVNGAVGSAPNTVALTSEYHYAQVVADMTVFNVNNVWMTYGDSSSLVNNQLILTSPYKRIALFSDIIPNATPNATLPASNNNITPAAIAAQGFRGGVYNGVLSANNTITDFGYFTALALVYDESENQAQASQFSPATTPTLNFHYEVSATEGNPTSTDNLSYYLQQAQANGGFERGYTLVQFIRGGAPTPAPTLATQMIATEAGGKVVTNWIVPSQN